ncbi:MAG: ABC transporter permease, partial [Epsilonproteobacteria bacterium]|nr:ABC transporter permease [Campylobacterota bacterium]
PIIYLKDLIAHKYPILITLNPFYYFIEPMQELFLYSKITFNYTSIAIVIISGMSAVWLYKKLIPEIKDMI